MRKFIPPFVYRLNRCADKDIDVLYRVVQILNVFLNTKADGDYQSELLFYLIVFSEMWETPTPSVSILKQRFTDVLISDTSIYTKTELYCAFSKEKSTTCNKFHFGNYDANPIIYERDEYWNKRAIIPTKASVLLLSSKLDVVSPHKHAEYLLAAPKGDNKELITFDYATYGMFMTTHLADDDYSNTTCGMKLLASFVKNGGDLELLDKSCVDKMPGFNMKIPTRSLQAFTLTADAYDGDYDESLNTRDSQSSSDEQ